LGALRTSGGVGRFRAPHTDCLVRIAVFGGSFNPVHLGHLVLADEVLEILGLDQVLFVPAGVPPHKSPRDVAPAVDRLAMVKLAVGDRPGFAVSDIEVRRGGASYTADTLAALSGRGDDLHLVVGSEMFLDLLTWRDPRRIAELARLVVVPRTGSAFDPGSDPARKVLAATGLTGFARPPIDPAQPRAWLVAATSLPLSSSDLRRRIREGRSIAYRVPEAVVNYIESHRLYRDEPAGGAARDAARVSNPGKR
jgi:nicotinate-nucleotide adenylyltransferase